MVRTCCFVTEHSSMSYYCLLLLRPQELRQSIVTSTSVCVSVWLSDRISLEPHMRSLPIFLCMLSMPWLGSPPAGWQNSKEKGQFWGFSSPLTMHRKVFAAKGIIQLPIMSCSKRDHSVAAVFDANGIGREGLLGLHSVDEMWSTIAVFYFALCACTRLVCHDLRHHLCFTAVLQVNVG